MEINWIMLQIFYMNCVNYSLIFMFASWDSRESSIPLVKDFFGGLYPDYNAFWFNDVGVIIVETMFFNMLYPLIEFFLYWPLRFLARVWDQRSCKCRLFSSKSTHAKTY